MRGQQFTMMMNNNSASTEPAPEEDSLGKRSPQMLIKLQRDSSCNTVVLGEVGPDDKSMDFTQSLMDASNSYPYPRPKQHRGKLALLGQKKARKTPSSRLYYNTVIEDYTNLELTETQRIELSIKSGALHNQRTLQGRKNTFFIMERLDKKMMMERLPIENMGPHNSSRRIPVKLILPSGQELFSYNQSLKPQKSSVQTFIDMNISNENSTAYQSSSRYGAGSFGVRNQLRKRRRKRNSFVQGRNPRR